MDCQDYIIEPKKGQHLNYDERLFIELRLKDGWNINKIAKALNRSYNGIKKEIKRGTVLLYHNKKQRYHAKQGQMIYNNNRKNSVRKYKLGKSSRFIQYVEQMFKKKKWSLGACVGESLKSSKFTREEIVSIKTLYNYVDKELIDIGKIDLPEKTKRSHKRERIRKNRKKLGDSIEERPKTVENREEFGNWEIDSVLGKKGEKEPIIVTMTERKTRKCIWLKARDHTADALMEVIEKAFKPYLERINEIFKTITADNGSEFSRLSELKSKGIGIYFTHPFSSFEKGTNECHNRMLRRFIPKGKSMLDYSQEDINYFVKIIDRLPRKILDYQTPEELFERELKNIYASK